MDIKLFISLYAALISTIVFIWRIYEFVDDKRGKLKVSLKRQSQAIVDQNNSIGQWQEFLVATVVNVGKYKRQIERPGVKIDAKIDGKNSFSFITFDDRTKFPLLLEPGEKFNYLMPIKGIDCEFKNKGASKIKSVVHDTHGKTYTSKWFRL